MKLAVFGAGYVGLVTAACLADVGHEVTCIDVDEAKVDALRLGIIPFHEPGLDAMVLRCVQRRRLNFTTDAQEGVPGRDAVFIAVGTPAMEDGAADLAHVRAVARTLARYISPDTVVVGKSTVPVGTADEVSALVADVMRERGAQPQFEVVSNPEFLKEGDAIDDFQRPDRIIIGTTSERAVVVMREIYAPFCRQRDRLLVMDARSAELTKYASNAMLAARISFMNEMAALSERLGADIESVRVGVGADPRIGPQFLYPGVGFGGSCFPKDLRALDNMARQQGLELELLPSITRVNDRQKSWLLRRISEFFGGRLEGRTICLWGLAFKPDTDDIREAPGCQTAAALLAAGARVQAYDPLARPNALAWLKHQLPSQALRHLVLKDTAEAAVHGADVLALATEWKEFRSPDFEWLAATLRERAVFDGRNQYRPQSLSDAGLAYFSVGRRDAPSSPAQHDQAGMRIQAPVPRVDDAVTM